MRFILLLSFVTSLCLSTLSIAALMDAPPIVQENVVILKNATPATCQAAQNGEGGAEEITQTSPVGEEYGSEESVRSCTGCSVNNNKDCVCNKCYYYAN